MSKAKAKEQPKSADDLLSEAIDLGRKAYWAHVRDIADEIMSQARDGEFDDAEACEEFIHCSIDGDGWVIYTQKAQLVLLCSDNDGAYEDDYGPEGIVEDGAIQWSRLAFCALRADVMESLRVHDFDPSDPETWKPGPEE